MRAREKFSRGIFRRLIWGCLRNTTYPKSVRAWQIRRFEYCRGTRSLPAESPRLSSREIIASAQLSEIIEPLRATLLALNSPRISLVTSHSFALSCVQKWWRWKIVRIIHIREVEIEINFIFNHCPRRKRPYPINIKLTFAIVWSRIATISHF